MASFRLSPLAVEDLEAIWWYSFKHWGIAKADVYIDALLERFTATAKAPQRTSDISHIRSGYRYARVEQHVFYFRTTDDGIAIIRILHGWMDPARYL